MTTEKLVCRYPDCACKVFDGTQCEPDQMASIAAKPETDLIHRLRVAASEWLPTSDHTLRAHKLLTEAADALANFPAPEGAPALTDEQIDEITNRHYRTRHHPDSYAALRETIKDAIAADRAALAAHPAGTCPCGDRPAAECEEQWGPRCDMGNNPAFAKAAPAPAEGDAIDKWEGAEEWMPLAWELCANENGEEACTELIWEGGPIPEPWGDRWLKYEDQAKEMIAMVRKHVRPQSDVQPKGKATGTLKAAYGDKWEGAEEWMPLAWELCANECGEDACTELIWEGGPIPEPWGDRWLKYEDQAKEMIAMVRKHVPAPAPALASAYAEVDDKLLTGQAQHLIGALMNHGLLPGKTLPEDKYLKLWDVVKAQLRAVYREAVRAAQAPAPAPADRLAQAMEEMLEVSGGQGPVSRRAREALAEYRAQAPAVRADDARDAARYRFLRDADRSDPAIDFETLLGLAMESMDAAIDAAMAHPPVQHTEAQR